MRSIDRRELGQRITRIENGQDDYRKNDPFAAKDHPDEAAKIDFESFPTFPQNLLPPGGWCRHPGDLAILGFGLA